jgi:hypothetical protein
VRVLFCSTEKEIVVAAFEIIEVQGTARLSPAGGVAGQEERSTSLRLE